MRIKLLLEFVESYDYVLVKDTENEIQYSFTDVNNNKYLVDFDIKNHLDKSYELTFRVFNNELDRYDLNMLTGVNPWKVMSTVLGDILQDFIRNHPQVNSIYIFAIPQEGQSPLKETTRSKLYKRFLERNCPEGWKLDFRRNEIYLAISSISDILALIIFVVCDNLSKSDMSISSLISIKAYSFNGGLSVVIVLTSNSYPNLFLFKI